MSFKNSGTTPSGRQFFRGEAILVERISHCLSGHIAEIGESDGEDFVTANVQTGVLNTMGGGSGSGKGPDQVSNPKFPPVEYEATGYRHQSTRQGRGDSGSSKGMLLFCFANETPTFAMGDAPGTTQPLEHTQPVDEPAGSNAPAVAAPPTPKQADPVRDPRDTNKDGVVSRKEQRNFDQKG